MVQLKGIPAECVFCGCKSLCHLTSIRCVCRGEVRERCHFISIQINGKLHCMGLVTHRFALWISRSICYACASYGIVHTQLMLASMLPIAVVRHNKSPFLNRPEANSVHCSLHIYFSNAPNIPNFSLSIMQQKCPSTHTRTHSHE